jgi:hypothetical protein
VTANVGCCRACVKVDCKSTPHIVLMPLESISHWAARLVHMCAVSELAVLVLQNLCNLWKEGVHVAAGNVMHGRVVEAWCVKQEAAIRHVKQDGTACRVPPTLGLESHVAHSLQTSGVFHVTAMGLTRQRCTTNQHAATDSA